MPYTTPVAALAACTANCAYDIHRSPSECALFIEACRAYLFLVPKQMKQGRMGGETTTSPEIVAANLAKAEAWYAINGPSTTPEGGGGGGVRFTDFSDFRC